MDCNRGHLGLSMVLKHSLQFQLPNHIADKSLPSVLREARSALSLTEVLLRLKLQSGTLAATVRGR
jgi:hypothetical protein